MLVVRLLICVAASLFAPVRSYGIQQQPSNYPTTAKPYYTTAAAYYNNPTTKPYYPVTTYPTTAYYSTTYPTTAYYTTNQPYTTTQAYYYKPSSYATTQTYYQEPSTYAATTQPPAYTTAGYYEGNDNGWYNYAFKFNVNDYYGNEQSRSETHENSMTKGKYTVNLPDGRKQVVTYEADQNGYRAQVSYEAAANDNSDAGNYYSTAKYESASSYDTYQTTPTYSS